MSITLPDTTATTEPVNPLTEPLTTILVKRSESQDEVQGRVIAPGLAITPLTHHINKAGNARYALTHMPSGLALRLALCGVHVQDVAKLATDSGVDWTLGDTPLIAAIKADQSLHDQLGNIRPCRSHCVGDGAPPPSWGVRCDTCDWEWEDEFNEGSLSAKDAKYMAKEHECEPQVTIQDPATGKWHKQHQVGDDGTVNGMESIRAQMSMVTE